MARARNIKPGFFCNDLLGECSPLARLLFIGLWTLADRKGRIEERPKRIRAELLPYDDDADVDALLEELSKANFIVRYKVGEQSLIQVANFLKHQNPHKHEKDSELPPPGLVANRNEHHASTVQAPDLHQTSIVVARLIPDSGFLIPDSGSLNEERGFTTQTLSLPKLEVKQEKPKPQDNVNSAMYRSKHKASAEFLTVWELWKNKLAYSNGRTMDPFTEESQLYSLDRFETPEAIEIVRFSTGRTICNNLIDNGDHKPRPSSSFGSGSRYSKPPPTIPTIAGAFG